MNLTIAGQGQIAGSPSRVVIREVGPGVGYQPYRRDMECPDIDCGPCLVLRQSSPWHAI
jgi:hypothetical protein